MATTSSNVWWSEMMQSAGMVTAATSMIKGITRLDIKPAQSEPMWVGLAYPGTVTYQDGRIEQTKYSTNCKNCGASLNWFKQACEYCGTFYAK